MPLKLHDLTESLGLQQTTKLSWVCLSIHVGIGEIGGIEERQWQNSESDLTNTAVRVNNLRASSTRPAAPAANRG